MKNCTVASPVKQNLQNDSSYNTPMTNNRNATLLLTACSANDQHSARALWTAGQRASTPCAWARPLSCCETKLRILSNKTCCLPTVLTLILWTTRYREWCRKMFSRSQRGALMSWSSVWLQRSRESNGAYQASNGSSNQWRERLNACVKAKGKHLEHLMCLSITVNLSGRLLFALLWLWTDWHMCVTNIWLR